MPEVTIRHRRKPEERATSILQIELNRLETRAAKSKAQWEKAEAAAEVVRKQIAMLHQLPLPMPPTEAPEPAQDTPPVECSATPAPAAESVVGVTPSETPLADARAGARERAVARGEGKCKHDFLAGWCSKVECQ